MRQGSDLAVVQNATPDQPPPRAARNFPWCPSSRGVLTAEAANVGTCPRGAEVWTAGRGAHMCRPSVDASWPLGAAGLSVACDGVEDADASVGVADNEVVTFHYDMTTFAPLIPQLYERCGKDVPT